MKKNLLTLDVALSKEIKYMLKEEHYLPGDKLPSERKLAELFHVQRLTVRGALDLLLQDKTIISKPQLTYSCCCSINKTTLFFFTEYNFKLSIFSC